MNTRLKQFLAAENITQAQFADNINVVRASVSHILSGRNNPSFDFIKAMMTKYPNLNMDWLMFGKGKMYKETISIESDQLFPVESVQQPQEETVPPAQRAQEIPPIAEEKDSVQFSSELNTLGNNLKTTVNQRKVTKVIIMFDDGSYQEL